MDKLLKLNDEMAAMITDRYNHEHDGNSIAQELNIIEETGIVPGIPIGERAPQFCLEDVNGREICLEDQLGKGPVVISFLRGNWCDYCQKEMDDMNQELSEIEKMGGSIIAVSPQILSSSREFMEKKKYGFTLLSDPDQEIIKLFNLQFHVPPNMKRIYRDVFKIDLTKQNANGTWNLPVPATFILDNKGVVVARHVSPHYDKRMPVQNILKTFSNLSVESSETISELKSKNEILTNQIAELTSLQEKLIRQENRAIVGDLTAGLFHELKNLLNPISALDFIKNDLSEENRKWIDFVYDARDRSIALMEEIRLLAKNQEVNYSFEKLSINKILSESIFLSRMDGDIRNIKIIEDFKSDPMVKVNRNKIIQVLLNLIRNAAHAVKGKDDGNITVISEQKGDEVLVHVQDNGSGIDSEQLEKIWNPFYSTKGDKGTGIGLGICRKIIEKHHGEMFCVSRLNEGSIFSFSIPLAG